MLSLRLFAAAVDGKPAVNYTQVKEALLGKTGTNVRVAFSHVTREDKRTVTLDLMRGSAPYIRYVQSFSTYFWLKAEAKMSSSPNEQQGRARSGECCCS